MLMESEIASQHLFVVALSGIHAAFIVITIAIINLMALIVSVVSLSSACLQVKLVGTWPTKFDALLRRILHMRTTHPDEKHLVFSYYDDALKLIKGALQANSLSHVEFMGGVKASTSP